MVRWFVVTSALGILAASALIDLAAPLTPPQLVGDELRADLLRRADATPWDGSQARLLEDDLAVTSRVRRALSDPYGQFLLDYLDESSGSVLIGPNQWLFYKARLTPDGADPAQTSRRFASFASALDRLLAAHGVQLVLIPVPRKGVAMEERLPFGVRVGAAFDEAVAPVLEETGLLAVDLLSAFRAHEGDPLFLRTDTHWSTEGIRVAAVAVAEAMGRLQQVRERTGILEPYPYPDIAQTGDLFRLLGIRPTANRKQETEHTHWRVLPEPPAPDPDECKIWLFGTSFSAEHFPAMLMHFTGTPIRSYSRRGFRTWDGLLEALQTTGLGGELEVILAELPCHQLLTIGRHRSSWSLPRGIPDAISLLAPDEDQLVVPRVEGLALDVDLENGTGIHVEGDGVLLRAPAGVTSHCGGGVLALDADITLADGAGNLVLVQGSYGVRFQLREGRHRYYVPLLAESTTSAPWRLFLDRSMGLAAEVHGVSLVAVAQKSLSRAAELGEVQAFGHVARQSARFNPPVPANRLHAVLLRNGGGSPGLHNMRLIPKSNGAPVGRELLIGPIRPSAFAAHRNLLPEGTLIDEIVIESSRPKWTGAESLELALPGPP